MKKTGIIILSIGLLFTLITAFLILTSDRVTGLGNVEVAQITTHHRVWEPMLGAILIMTGMGIYKVGKKSEVKTAWKNRVITYA